MVLVPDWESIHFLTSSITSGKLALILILRFPDDFLVQGFCDNGDSVLYVYSQSRLGVSDLGVNKARVESFAEHMVNVEMATSECV